MKDKGKYFRCPKCGCELIIATISRMNNEVHFFCGYEYCNIKGYIQDGEIHYEHGPHDDKEAA